MASALSTGRCIWRIRPISWTCCDLSRLYPCSGNSLQVCIAKLKELVGAHERDPPSRRGTLKLVLVKAYERPVVVSLLIGQVVGRIDLAYSRRSRAVDRNK